MTEQTTNSHWIHTGALPFPCHLAWIHFDGFWGEDKFLQGNFKGIESTMSSLEEADKRNGEKEKKIPLTGIGEGKKGKRGV